MQLHPEKLELLLLRLHNMASPNSPSQGQEFLGQTTDEDQGSSISTDSLSSFHSDDLISIQDLIDQSEEDKNVEKKQLPSANDVGSISSPPKSVECKSDLNICQKELEKLQLKDQDQAQDQMRSGIQAKEVGNKISDPKSSESGKVVSPERKAVVHNFLNQAILSPKKTSLNLFPLSPSVLRSNYLHVLPKDSGNMIPSAKKRDDLANPDSDSVCAGEEKAEIDVSQSSSQPTGTSSKENADGSEAELQQVQVKHDQEDKYSNDELDLNGPYDDIKKREKISELKQLRQLVKNANFSLKALKEIYEKRKDDECNLSFVEMRSAYAEKVYMQGKLSKEVSRLRMEVRSVNKSLGNINWELDQIKGRQRSDNPWQLGVPYGYRAVNGRAGRKK